MTGAKILQWPLEWSLSKVKGKEKARQIAREIAVAGQLRSIVEKKYIGRVRLLVIPRGKIEGGWRVNIRPVHWGNRESFRRFEFDQVKYIEFEYSERAVTQDGRYPNDPSTYLRIKNVIGGEI